MHQIRLRLISYLDVRLSSSIDVCVRSVLGPRIVAAEIAYMIIMNSTMMQGLTKGLSHQDGLISSADILADVFSTPSMRKSIRDDSNISITDISTCLFETFNPNPQNIDTDCAILR